MFVKRRTTRTMLWGGVTGRLSFTLTLVCGMCLPMLSGGLPGVAQAPVAKDQIIAELRQNHAAEALRDAEEALRAHPGDATIWILKGLAKNQLGESGDALSAFESALRLAPTSLPALEGALETAFRIDRVKAKALVTRVLAQVPAEPNANGIAGMLAYDNHQWAEAVEHFGKAHEAIATQQTALRAEAVSLDHLGRDAEAEEVLLAISKRRPDDLSARYDLAVVQLRQQHLSQALATLEPLLAAHDEASLTLAANVYEAEGDTPHAVESLRQAIQQDPKNPQNYLDFATLSFDHSSFAAGIAMLDAGLTQLPRSAALHVARGILYMQVSGGDRAEQDFDAANKLDPAQAFGSEAQGLTEIQRHDLPAALTKVQNSLRTTPQNAYLHYLAAQILTEEGSQPSSPQAQQALGYAERAVALDPRLTEAWDLLSGLEFQAGNYSKAIADCRTVLRYDPTDQQAIFRLILALRRTGDQGKEIAGLVESLKQARALEHTKQVRIDKYRLSTGPETR